MKLLKWSKLFALCFKKIVVILTECDNYMDIFIGLCCSTVTPYILQHYKRYTIIYRLLYSLLDIAGQEKIVVYSVVYCCLRFLHLSFFFYCHMSAYYSSTCTNDRLGMMVWCYFKKCCHFNAPLYSYSYTKY